MSITDPTAGADYQSAKAKKIAADAQKPKASVMVAGKTDNDVDDRPKRDEGQIAGKVAARHSKANQNINSSDEV